MLKLLAPRYNLVGATIGEWTVLAYVGKSSKGVFQWHCQCSCGRRSVVRDGALRWGQSKSCGHSRGERHGHRIGHNPSPTYGTWEHMKQRCLNPKNKRYESYGGRGIGICDRWLLFSNFLADMGERPEGTSIERRDNTKGYSPDNCYWATRLEQMNNTRRNHFIEYKGETKSIAEWARAVGLGYTTLNARIKYGWSVSEAIETRVLAKHEVKSRKRKNRGSC